MKLPKFQGSQQIVPGPPRPRSEFLTRVAFDKQLCRLGLASRGPSELNCNDVLEAIDRGVNFFNWPGASEGPPKADALSQAIGSLGSRRDSIAVCTQLASRTAAEAAEELRAVLSDLRTDYLDLVTFYYVEEPSEWELLLAGGGALRYCQQAKSEGWIRRLGVTSHQRSLAAEMARSGLLDALMIRYNAAHRGAEDDVFPVTDALDIPVIAYTALHWGALLEQDSNDPIITSAADWYRFVLQSDSVTVVLAAPANRDELLADMAILEAGGPLSAGRFEELAAQGQRVRLRSGRFP